MATTTAWRDLALDPSTGDLVIEGGDFALVQGEDAIAQACGIALRMWAGEYPFNTSIGGAWADVLNQIGATDDDLAAEVRRLLVQVQGVSSVDSVIVVRDSTARTATVTAQVRASVGVVLTVPTVQIGV